MLKRYGIGRWVLPAIAVLTASVASAQQQQRPGAPPYIPSSNLIGGGATGGVQVAYAQVQQAMTDLKTANEQVERYNKEAKAKLAKDPEWTKAQEALESTRVERDKVHQQAMAALHDSEPYHQQQAKLKAAQAIIDNQSSTIPEVDKATSDAIDARMAISQMESKGLKDSPEVKDADAKYASAQTESNNLWEQYKAKELPANHPWQAAIKQQEQAQQAVKAAQDQLVAARKDAAALRQTTPRPAQTTGSSRRSSSSYGGGSRSSGSRGSSSYGSRGY